MKRVEIIVSQAIEDDFLYQRELLHVMNAYTKFPNVMGTGCSSPKMGDSIWPQLNTCIMSVVEETEVPMIISLVKSIRETYPLEGVGCFVSDVQSY